VGKDENHCLSRHLEGCNYVTIQQWAHQNLAQFREPFPELKKREGILWTVLPVPNVKQSNFSFLKIHFI
jgi:hypothetical protein